MLAAVGVGYLAWDAALHHPDSWLGRGVNNAQKVAASQARTMEMGRRTAELAVTSMKGLLSQKTVSCKEECPAPEEDACPVAPAVLPGAVVMREDEVDLPVQAMPPVHEFVVGEECEEAAMPAVPEEAVKMPGCEDDCCRPQPEAVPAPQAVMPGCGDGNPVHPMSEESEPVFPKMDYDGGEKPAHPDVDTMEIRPSDLWFLDYTGPF